MITPLEAGAAFTSGCCTLYVKQNATHTEVLRDFETIRKCMERFIDDRALAEHPNWQARGDIIGAAARQNPNLR